LPQGKSLGESLLGVGLPGKDLSLLLLIPLIAIGLVIVELLVSSRRHRAPVWHLRRPRQLR
jgi:hypothetical protein